MKKILFLLILFFASQSSFATPNTDSVLTAHDAIITQTWDTLMQLSATTRDIKKAVDTLQKKAGCDCVPQPRKDEPYWFWISGAWLLILIPLALFITLLVIVANKLKDFKLDEALAENSIDKITIQNPEYKVDKIADLIEKIKDNPVATGSLSTLFPVSIEVSDSIQETINRSLKDKFEKKVLGEKRLDDISVEIAKLEAATPKDTGKIAELTAEKEKITKEIKDITVFDDPAALNKYTMSKTTRPSSSRLIAFVASILLLILILALSCFFIYYYIYTGCPPDLSKFTVVLVALGITMTPYAVNKVAGAVSSNKGSNS